jgi:hypothetical protein
MNAATLNPTATDVANTHTTASSGNADPGPEQNSASADRDARGRFATGNRGGPGNPFARQTAAMHRALCAEVSKEDLAAMTRKLKEMALAGNMAALKLLFSYVVGRPQAATNPDTLDLQEWSQLKQAAPMLEEMPTVMKSLTAEDACDIARAAQPVFSQEIVNEIGEGVQRQEEAAERRRERKEARRQRREERQQRRAQMRQEREARRQTTDRPVETRQPQPSPIGGNGPDRYAGMTAEQILEEIRNLRRQQETEAFRSSGLSPGQGDGRSTPPPSPIGNNGRDG